MRLNGPGSDNIVDRRGGGGAGGKLAVGGVGTLVILAASYFLGFDPSFLLSQTSQQPSGQAAQTSPADDKKAEFVSQVLGSTEEVWVKVFAEQKQAAYKKPKLVMYTGSTRTACGNGSAAMGPFYCPADQQAYLDLSFFKELDRRFGAPGDFAQAYVIAHEIGHHIQTITGISNQVRAKQRGMSKAASNELSVRQELQADCFSGVWAHHADKMRGVLEEGDVEEALRAAAAIGDDAIQKRSQGYVVPDSFTHGTSQQRARWFTMGLRQGTMQSCDTFSARSL